MKRSLLTVSLVVFSSYAGSCKQSFLPEPLPIRSIHVAAPLTKDTYSVEELLVNPQSVAHTVVTVSGCYMGGFEISALMACDRRSAAVWVEGAERFEQERKFNQILGQLTTGEARRRYMVLAKEELLFAYDERRNSLAWHKLLAKSTLGSEVVLLGQFETSDTIGGFGHGGDYSNKLILLDVLSNESTNKRSKPEE